VLAAACSALLLPEHHQLCLPPLLPPPPLPLPLLLLVLRLPLSRGRMTSSPRWSCPADVNTNTPARMPAQQATDTKQQDTL
jgi:hypothetical protein